MNVPRETPALDTRTRVLTLSHHRYLRVCAHVVTMGTSEGAWVVFLFDFLVEVSRRSVSRGLFGFGGGGGDV